MLVRWVGRGGVMVWQGGGGGWCGVVLVAGGGWGLVGWLGWLGAGGVRLPRVAPLVDAFGLLSLAHHLHVCACTC